MPKKVPTEVNNAHTMMIKIRENIVHPRKPFQMYLVPEYNDKNKAEKYRNVKQYSKVTYIIFHIIS